MIRRLLCGLLGFATVLAANASGSDQRWPQFRGPNAAGCNPGAKPPVKIAPGTNVAWQVEVPWSPSSPCVWDDSVFLTTFANGELQTRCHRAGDGRLVWSQSIRPGCLETYHGTDGSPAAGTPATDGKRVVSYFGSFGLVCYDRKGKELWRHPLPVALSGGSFGSGTSPVIFGNLVLVNRDQDQNSSLLALNLKSGKTVWETPRPEARGSFGTPILWEHRGAREVIMAGSVRLKAYDLKSGKERWMVDGLTGFSCTTPVVGEGMLYYAGWSPGQSDSPWPSWETFVGKHDQNGDGRVELTEFDSGTRDYMRGLDHNRDGALTKEEWTELKAAAAKSQNLLVAVKPGGKGDVTQTHVAWKANRGLPYVPSPLFYDERVYIIKDGGMISCFEAQTGKPCYLQERLEAKGSYYSSPVAADGRIYLASLEGKVTVIRAGGEMPEVLHTADFGERILATPALAGNRIYLRTQTKLYAFSTDAMAAARGVD